MPRCVLLPVFTLFISTLFLLSCRPAQSPPPQTQTYIGKIYLIGNMPFAKLAIETDQKQMFVLDCAKEVAADLMQRQGQTLRIVARPGEKMPEGNSLKVMQAEVLQQ